MREWTAGGRYRRTDLPPEVWTKLWGEGFRWVDDGPWRTLVDGPGLLTPERIRAATTEDAWTWVVLPEVDTTMRVAREYLAEGRGPVVVLADRQHRGRGRRGRSWMDIPGGSLTLSLGWLPDGNTDGPLTLAVGVAVAEVLEAATGVGIGLKWPNDGLVRERKVMGILAEAGRDPRPWVVVGVGVNVNGSAPPEVPDATTLETEAGRPFDRAALAVAVADGVAAVLRSWAEPLARDRWLARWRERSVTLGRPVEVIQDDQKWSGFAEDVDTAGLLLVRTPLGDLVPVAAGDVSLRPWSTAG
jgi:BirA family biotin operon repressor/biotin-[acetyl-CoA-carboxylase] ligase